MDLELSDDQRDLRAVAAGTLDRHAPPSLARAYLDGSGDAAALWAALRDLGWLGVGLDEDPFGIPGLCLLAHEIGRHVAPTTLVDTAVVARVALGGDSPWGERIVAGDPTVALALLGPSSSWAASGPETLARRDGDAVVVSGAKVGVHHAAAVGRLAVVAELDGARALALVDARAPGVAIDAGGGLDPSCAGARVVLHDVRVSPGDVLAGPAVERALVRALDIGAVATTAEGLGAASRALDLAVTYALERIQYGRPIGAFQGLQHLIAEQHHLRETAWAAVLYAAAALEEDMDDAAAAVAVAKAHGATATRSVVEGALQVFGGVGFTREHDLHLLYRRALECAARFGGPVEHERRVAADLLRPALAVCGHRPLTRS